MWNFEYFGQIDTDWIHRGFSGWDFESYGQFNIEQMIVMAHVNEVRTFYLDWNTSVLFRAAEWLKCRTVACTRNTHIINFCEWIPEFRALGTNQVSQICIITCTSSSPLCPGFLPQVSCLDILSEFPKKVRILRCFAVLAKSLASKTKFGLLPKRVWINKESRKEDLSLTTRSWHFGIDICSGCCDLSPIVIYWEGTFPWPIKFLMSNWKDMKDRLS